MFISYRAKIFDGITEARMRALVEAGLPSDGHHEYCIVHGKRTPADVLWVHAPTGRISPLCKEHVDDWLENADIVETPEPPVLVPLRGRKRS